MPGAWASIKPAIAPAQPDVVVGQQALYVRLFDATGESGQRFGGGIAETHPEWAVCCSDWLVGCMLGQSGHGRHDAIACQCLAAPVESGCVGRFDPGFQPFLDKHLQFGVFSERCVPQREIVSKRIGRLDQTAECLLGIDRTVA